MFDAPIWLPVAADDQVHAHAVELDVNLVLGLPAQEDEAIFVRALVNLLRNCFLISTYTYVITDFFYLAQVKLMRHLNENEEGPVGNLITAMLSYAFLNSPPLASCL